MILIIFSIFLFAVFCHASTNIVIGVDGGTESIRACCFNADTGEVVGKSSASQYKTLHPRPGWAEQNPSDWWNGLGQAVRGALATLKGSDDYSIKGLCVDTTCCSVVALDKNYEPLRPCLLWMDQRSAPQTQEILEMARGDPALEVNGNGDGPLSAEWMTPKSLWLKQNEPGVWESARIICEYQDYINYRLTGTLCASSCNAAARWHWDGNDCLEDGKGRPLSLYKKLGMSELATKLPQKCIAMGTPIGKGLTKEAATFLNLPVNLPVLQGGPDAFVGMVGLGCVTPGKLCLITGSSHLHCVVTSQASRSKGIWGAYRGAPLPHLNFAEGGQSSTGSIMRWAKDVLFGNSERSYEELDEEASKIEPGSEGLVALETFQGSRTPVTDPLARGALLGLTLSHKQAHIWRACLEAVCFGTRSCMEGLAAAGHECEEIILAGGVTNSPLWLQLHADITGKPVVVCETSNAPLLGCAILAAVGAGIHESIEQAVEAMVRTSKRIEPDPERAKSYNVLYEHTYAKVSPAVRPVMHAIGALRGGENRGNKVIISPSLLSANWANMATEVKRCIKAGVTQLHVDIFDGVFIPSPHALTFGPKMVQDIRQSLSPDEGRHVILDLHMCVNCPERYVHAMADAGATRFIFQWEAMKNGFEDALALARDILESGMECGVSINPETPVADVVPLLEQGIVTLVDVLSVNAGFGGQKFQEHVLEKIRELAQWRSKKQTELLILVDGGINSHTAPMAAKAGADILVAGTFLFQHPHGLADGVKELKSKHPN